MLLCLHNRILLCLCLISQSASRLWKVLRQSTVKETRNACQSFKHKLLPKCTFPLRSIKPLSISSLYCYFAGDFLSLSDSEFYGPNLTGPQVLDFLLKTLMMSLYSPILLAFRFKVASSAKVNWMGWWLFHDNTLHCLSVTLGPGISLTVQRVRLTKGSLAPHHMSSPLHAKLESRKGS